MSGIYLQFLLACTLLLFANLGLDLFQNYSLFYAVYAYDIELEFPGGWIAGLWAGASAATVIFVTCKFSGIDNTSSIFMFGGSALQFSHCNLAFGGQIYVQQASNLNCWFSWLVDDIWLYEGNSCVTGDSLVEANSSTDMKI